jgi:hypothetical protein
MSPLALVARGGRFRAAVGTGRAAALATERLRLQPRIGRLASSDSRSECPGLSASTRSCEA